MKEREMKPTILATLAIALVFTLALALALAATACKDKPDPDPVLCTCAVKEHYLPCTCGGTDCTCAVIPRGHITEYGTNKQIPIYQSVGVPDDKAVTATTTIINGYNAAGNNNKQAVSGKIQKIIIVNGTDVTCTPDGVVSIGADCTYGWNDIIIEFIQPAVNGE